MAKVVLNGIAAQLSGRIGDIVFKWYGDKLVACKASKRRKRKPDAAEKQRRNAFAEANAYATGVLLDPVRSAAYAAVAKKLGRTIQNVAISDYLKRPEINAVTRGRGPDMGAQTVVIHTPNAHKIVAMHVVLRGARRRVIERGEPEQDGKLWSYTTTQILQRSADPITIEVTASDRLGKTSTKTVTLAL